MLLTPDAPLQPHKGEHTPAPYDGRERKRLVLLLIFVLSWLSTAVAWLLMESRGISSPTLRGVFGANIVFHPVMFALVYWRRLPERVVDVSCLLFAAGICAACMVLRLYFPAYGASIDLEPLYLWIPVIYVFAFTVAGHKSSLAISLGILALFFVISLPYLVHSPTERLGNFTIQLHMVSAVLIAALYFFSSYQHRLQLAQLTMDELATLSHTDELTRLPNRRRIAQVVSYELLRFARHGRGFALVMIDIDHFKDVNDQFGHRVGDQALKALAVRAGETLRDGDTLGRWGGEEFVIVLPEAGLDEALHKAQALCAHVVAAPLINDQLISISCGVTRVVSADTAESLFHRADMALYAAKQHGRNRAESMAVA
ncbi:GGDEF domain-containing protein [Rhodanobacter glycinis]|uniref:diguanylate cyclase n=1 Tax=Rhodanobacter glycinis TaxID=582702 RepID=A0A5B9DVC8_9GAMM|nr:GGDEF domain-containing protein [Rhodanobacter glycinis]QEE23763.1 GGDEF domain-containing protein [Rhodanobacter glycinis]